MFEAAAYNGVMPFLAAMCLSAPFLIKKQTASSWPELASMLSGVQPLLHGASLSPPASKSTVEAAHACSTPSIKRIKQRIWVQWLFKPYLQHLNVIFPTGCQQFLLCVNIRWQELQEDQLHLLRTQSSSPSIWPSSRISLCMSLLKSGHSNDGGKMVFQHVLACHLRLQCSTWPCLPRTGLTQNCNMFQTWELLDSKEHCIWKFEPNCPVQHPTTRVRLLGDWKLRSNPMMSHLKRWQNERDMVRYLWPKIENKDTWYENMLRAHRKC